MLKLDVDCHSVLVLYAHATSCESAVFIFASSAAARRWPVTADKEAALRAAMRYTIPRNLKRASKADKAAQRQRKKRRLLPRQTAT